MKMNVLAFGLAIGTAMTLSAGAQASDGAVFCGAIGLSKANQATCTKQLARTTNDYDRQSIQAKWVARSGIVAGPDYYVTKVGFVPNRVAAQINRALDAALTKPEWKSQIAQTEVAQLTDTSIEYTN